MRLFHLLFGLSLLAGGEVYAEGAGATSQSNADALTAARSEVTQREAAAAELTRRRDRLVSANQRTTHEIDQQMAEASTPARDAKLKELLALAQSRAQELERIDAEQRTIQEALLRARTQLVRRCDQELAVPNITDSQRVELLRVRAVQVAALVQPSRPVGIGAPTSSDPLDGPRELEEKADLLRDSSDKLRKEARRIATRIDDLERRRHLRERSSAVDEDWFSESTSNRRFARTTTSTGGATASKSGGTAEASPSFAAGGGTTGGSANDTTRSPSPPVSGAVGDAGYEPSPSTATVLRNLVDPATLEELRRADRGDDVDRQIRALRRAQGELSELATDLDKKGKTLQRRAVEIRNQK